MKPNQFIQFLLFLFIVWKPFSASSKQMQNQSTEKVQNSWLKTLKSSGNLDRFYSENSGIMINDELFTGTNQVSKKVLELKKGVGEIESYTVEKTYQIRRRQKFALGTYHTKSGAILNSIIGWRYIGKWTKEFEVIYQHSKCSKKGKDLVNKARKNWEMYSNMHKPELIVKNVFSKNGKYFNRGKLYKDTEIANAYSYMKNDSYKIKLESLKSLQVNCDILFDIGTFEVGGKGLYTLIWKKESDGWKLLLDFNF